MCITATNAHSHEITWAQGVQQHLLHLAKGLAKGTDQVSFDVLLRRGLVACLGEELVEPVRLKESAASKGHLRITRNICNMMFGVLLCRLIIISVFTTCSKYHHDHAMFVFISECVSVR